MWFRLRLPQRRKFVIPSWSHISWWFIKGWSHISFHHNFPRWPCQAMSLSKSYTSGLLGFRCTVKVAGLPLVVLGSRVTRIFCLVQFAGVGHVQWHRAISSPWVCSRDAGCCRGMLINSFWIGDTWIKVFVQVHCVSKKVHSGTNPIHPYHKLLLSLSSWFAIDFD